jgi:hypothetical protein
MRGSDIQALVQEAVKGLRCSSIEIYAPHSWRFEFGASFGLNVQCPWRIVTENGIALGSEDDAQQFGLPARIDGAKLAMELLSANSVESLTFSSKTGDVLVEFRNSIRLEIFNNSMGYEGWNCGTGSGLQVIGMGGGGTANSMGNVGFSKTDA